MTGANLAGAALEVAQKRETQGLNHTLGVHFTKVEPGLVEAEMPITPALLQPFGFLHGGATIALLESVASAGGELACDLETEQPFGVEVTIRHKKSGREGDVARGVAKLAERKAVVEGRLQAVLGRGRLRRGRRRHQRRRHRGEGGAERLPRPKARRARAGVKFP